MAVAGLTGLAACSDSGGNTDPEPTPTMSVGLSATTLTLVQGQNGTVTANITRGGGFSGAVALTAEGAPAGLTVAFAPASVATGVTSSTITVTAAGNLAAGTYPVTIRGTGTGVSASTVTLNVTVNVPPGITVAVNPATLTLAQGGNTSTTVTITRQGAFTGAVNLALEGAPAGVTGTFNPTSIGAGVTTSTLTINATQAAVAGTSNLTLRATGTGVTDRTLQIPVTVTASVPAGFTLALAPAAVTVQQGASGTTKLTATRAGGFAGGINLSATGAPAGVTIGLPSPTLTGDTMTLTVQVAPVGSAGGSPLPGDYPITITGQGTGVTQQTAALTLTVTAAPGGYTLTVSPNAANIQAGTNGRAAVRIARAGGFNAAVTLSVTTPANGPTATLAETTTLADSVEMTINVGANVAPATYPINIVGMVAGAVNQAATMNVTVTPAPTGGFTVALAPATVSVQQGANATSAFNITRTGGFTGAVNVSIIGVPPGLTVTADSATVGGTSTTIRVAAAGNLATGNYAVTVRGSATGQGDQNVTLTVTVTAPPVGGNVTLSFCPNDVPLFVAAQSGTGAWVRVNGVNGQFSFNIAGRGGVAYVDDANDLNIFYGTETELRGIGGGQCIGDDPPVGKKVTGSVAGLGLTDIANITLGPAVGSANSFAANFELNNVPDGALDLIASRMTIDLGTGTFNANKFIIRRGLNVPANTAIPLLDFNAAEAFDPVTPNLTINGLGNDTAFLSLSYYTSANAGTLGFGTGAFYFAGQQPANGTYPGIPAARQAANDLHFMLLVAGVSAADTMPTRFRMAYFKTAGNQAVTLGPQLSAPTISVLSTTPNLRVRAQVARQNEYDDVISATYSQTSHFATVTATAGYFGTGFTTWDLSMPDLSGLGFDPAWGLAAVTTEWRLSAVSYTGITPSLDPTPAEGVVVEAASRGGRIVP